MLKGFQLLIEKESVPAISASISSTPDVKTSSNVVPLSDAKNLGSHLPTRLPSTPKRSVLSHSAAFRLRHQAAKQQGAKNVRDLQDRSGLTTISSLHSRVNTVTGPFGGNLVSSSVTTRKVPSSYHGKLKIMGSVLL
ncbi:unnamed protein product [Hymenolepis diminuta]|uniref:DUF5734 domain-containing protein n=1 Tax=Hymenolepis diminuta TaxID=6216 RepID=A0A0R3SIR3_HYMDI|nr:unnamed protein product [Hymenolepis diminuta]